MLFEKPRVIHILLKSYELPVETRLSEVIGNLPTIRNTDDKDKV